jgi:SAM-dependent methyltransferase
MGADYVEFLRAGARAVGVDLSLRSIEHARRRSELTGFEPRLSVTDAERLPFRDGAFDLAYSWGVAHHSPDTARVFAEIARVLRPGGLARIAIYHHPSWGGFLIWGRNAVMRGRPLRDVRSVVAESLESPGTRLFTRAEARRLCAPFARVLSLRTQLGLGDLLTMDPSAKYRDRFSRLVWMVYPRWLIRRLGHRLGGYLLIECER